MYIINLENELKNQIHFKNQNEVAKEIGISPITLSKILNGKQTTQKTTAYCITKAFDKNGKILNYFKLVK